MGSLTTYARRHVDIRLATLFPGGAALQTPGALGDPQALVAVVPGSATRNPGDALLEESMCRILPTSRDQAEIGRYLNTCRECRCKPQLQARLTQLEREAASCRAEQGMFENLMRSNPRREEFQNLADNGQCDEVRAKARTQVAAMSTPPPQIFVPQPQPQPPATGSTLPNYTSPRCGWYAIAYCSQDYDAAASINAQVRGEVVDTSNRRAYPNFASGWYCVAKGPSDRGTALSRSQAMKGMGYGTAYAKNACQ